MSSCLRQRYYLPQSQWISLSKAVIFFITISSSMIHGQISYDYNNDFQPTYGPHGPSFSNNNNKRYISRDGGSFGNGDVQSSFLDLFDWSKDMPVQEIRNTFLDDSRDLPILQDLQQSCSKKDFFYGANPSHMSVVMKIKNLIMEQTSAHDAIMMAGSLRDKPEVNPNAWLRGVLAASMHRDDLLGLRKPAMLEVMPSMLINSIAIGELKQQASYPQHSRTCVRVDESAGQANGVENLLWYWREDSMVNSHHWYWHLTYPFTNNAYRPDRRGELFVASHHDILARYHAERLANGLPPVSPLNLERGTVLREPYITHLTDANSGNNWSNRPANIPISDVMSTAIPIAPYFISVDNRTLELRNILQSIADGTLIAANGSLVSIKDYTGIDIVGEIVEASEFSINPAYYGYFGVHNTGHVLIGLVTDPYQRSRAPPGVMADPATAMRDPIFYPYHTFIDDIFDGHKRTLEPYKLSGGDWPLVWPGVQIMNVKVQSHSLPANHLQTFWGEKKYDLSRGLDFNRSAIQGPLFTCVKHLDHQDFEYRFTVNRNDFAHSGKATFRVFLAPRYDHKGRKYMMEEQRRKFFVLDRFTAILNPGKNTITRKSTLSSVTIDFPQSYQILHSAAGSQYTPYCGCGWPHHLLLPKGTHKGMMFDLFVMVTNSDEDFVPQSGRPQVCKSAEVFCGIPGELYPDARPMNYPFDRSIYHTNKINPLDHSFDTVEGHITLDEWVSEIPNAAFAKVTITHLNELRGNSGGNFLNQYNGNINQGNIQGPAPVTLFQQDFDSSVAPGLNSILNEPTPDVFNKFSPAPQASKQYHKRLRSGIEPPTKEFLSFIG